MTRTWAPVDSESLPDQVARLARDRSDLLRALYEQGYTIAQANMEIQTMSGEYTRALQDIHSKLNTLMGQERELAAAIELLKRTRDVAGFGATACKLLQDIDKFLLRYPS